MRRRIHRQAIHKTGTSHVLFRRLIPCAATGFDSPDHAVRYCCMLSVIDQLVRLPETHRCIPVPQVVSARWTPIWQYRSVYGRIEHLSFPRRRAASTVGRSFDTTVLVRWCKASGTV